MRILFCGLLLAGLGLVLASGIQAGDDFKPEPGFVLLFNGKNFDGWKTKEGEKLDGKNEAYAGRYKIMDGALVIDYKVKGDKYIYTQQEFADVHLKFDYLPGPGCNNDLFLHGAKFDIKEKKGDVKNQKDGDWNTFEIIAKGDQVEYKNNGETQKTVKAKGASSAFGIRAEFGEIKIRRIRAQVGK